MTINVNNTYFGLSRSGVSSLFGSSNFGTSNSLLSNTALYKGFSEVSSPSYKHLLKKYFAEMEESDEEDSDKSSATKKLLGQSDTAAANAVAAKELKSDAKSVISSAEALTSVDKDGENELFSKDRETIDKAVKKFVNEYNDLVKTVSNGKYSNSRMTDLQTQLKAMSSVGQYSLKKIGITANSNGTLSIDEKSYASADVNSIKDVFSGSGSFAKRAAEKAEYIEKNAARYTTDAYGTYNKNKNYNNLYNTGNLFNSFF